MLLKISFLLPHLFCSVEFDFTTTKQSSEILILKIEMLEFQDKKNIEIIGF